MGTLGLYVHIPFCRQKCGYCDFISFVVGDEAIDSYVTVLCAEIVAQGGLFASGGRRRVDTIYLGGGTPSLLTAEQVERIFSSLRAAFAVDETAEITIEANPGTVTQDKMTAWRRVGINRVSLGIQSLQDHVLAKAGRIHGRSEALRCLQELRQAGFVNLSADLIYGLPGQKLDDVVQDCRELVRLGLEHLSVYGLTVEDDTPFRQLQQQGRLALPEEEVEDAMYEAVVHELESAGYERYEISNYCRSGHYSRHNSKYWRFAEYLGLGAGAHSFVSGRRWANPAELEEYLQVEWPGFSLPDQLDPDIQQGEYIMLALRTRQGVDAEDYQRHFGHSFDARYGEVTHRMVGRGWLVATSDGIRLTSAGMKFGNRVFREYLGK